MSAGFPFDRSNAIQISNFQTNRLLDEPVDISDLRDLSPVLANSMQSILDYEENDLDTVFGLHFEVTREIFGETQQVLLRPHGDKIPVTQENK